MVGLSTLLTVAVLVVALLSLLVVYRIDRPDGAWGALLRRRFVMGVPWGTLVSVLFVLAVYLFVQGGIDYWSDPVTIPFRAWGFLYPLGMVTASFSHTGLDHLIGNLAGTVVLAPVAEYAWGHYPRERGSSSFGSLRTNPWVRALLVFPAAVVLGGIVLAAVSLGPVIGFSGVVFAFAGFALVRYPIAAVVGLVGADLVRRVYFALQYPILEARPEPSPPSPPGWAEVAIQGHAVGLLLGVIVGIYVFRKRDAVPSAARVWFGVALFAVDQALWAVYWFRGNEVYVLFQGVGVVLVGLLAILVALAVTASGKPLVARLGRRGLAMHPEQRPDEPVAEADGGDSPSNGADVGDGDGDADRSSSSLYQRIVAGFFLAFWEVKRRHVAVFLLVLAFVMLGGAGLGSNAVSPADPSPPGESVAVGDYSVSYAEGVTNEMVSIVQFSAFNQSTSVETSGVIVTSDRREIWYQAVSKQRLAFSGVVSVEVGGLGWRDRVYAIRRGWTAAGGGAAYKVWLAPAGEPRELVFRSPPANASPVIGGRNVSVVAARGNFSLRVTRNDSTLGTVAIPDAGNATTVAGLRFVNRDGTVYARDDGTRVEVAAREEYQ